MTTDAFLFAGQGAQYVGMGAEAAEAFPEVAAALTEADEALGEPLSRVIAAGPEEALTLTHNAQPAILALGVGHLRLALGLGLSPRVLLGHSLGEYAAWVAAGSLSFEDAVRLVRRRGQFMQEAVPVGVGAMSAIISAPTEVVERLCAEVSAPGRLVAVAVYNCPGNVVVSGHVEGVEALERAVEEGRHGMPRRLAVSAPFHCELLAPAAKRLAEALAETEVRPNTLPVIANVTAEVVEPGASPEAIRELLVRQVQAPVRWEASLRRMLALGVERALTFGPGTMIQSQLKRVKRRMPMVSLDRLSDIREKLQQE